MCHRSHCAVGSLKRTSQPSWDIYSNRPLILWRSQTQSPSAGQLHKAGKAVTPGENARKPSAPNTHLFRTMVSTVEDSVLCAVNVGKHSSTNPHLFCTRESTLEKSFMYVVNVENLLGKAQPSINIEEFILGQGSTSAANVGNP